MPSKKPSKAHTCVQWTWNYLSAHVCIAHIRSKNIHWTFRNVAAFSHTVRPKTMQSKIQLPMHRVIIFWKVFLDEKCYIAVAQMQRMFKFNVDRKNIPKGACCEAASSLHIRTACIAVRNIQMHNMFSTLQGTWFWCVDFRAQLHSRSPRQRCSSSVIDQFYHFN